MKKKFFVVILALSLAAGLCGCGKQAQDTSPEDTAAAEEHIRDDADPLQVAQENVQQEDADGDGETAEAQQEEVRSQDAFLQVGISSITDSISDVQNDLYQVVNTEYPRVELLDDCAVKYAALQKALDEQNVQTEEYARAEFEEMCDRYYEYGFEYEYCMSYDAVRQTSVLRADLSALSLLTRYYSYAGGVHGYYSLTGYTYDVESGKRLSLSDVIVDEAACRAMIKEKVLEQHEAEYLFVDADTYFDELSLDGQAGQDGTGIGETFNWSMDYSGVTVYFNPYEIASYAEGIVEARLPFAEKPEMFAPKYVQAPEVYVEPVDIWSVLYADLDQDGKEEQLGCWNRETDYASTWTFRLGETTVESPVESYANDSYLVHVGDRNYLYMFDLVDNDGVLLSIMDAGTGVFLENDTAPDCGLVKLYDPDTCTSTQVEFTDPHCFPMNKSMDFLSTYIGRRIYHVGAHGKPESDETMYHVNTQFLIRNHSEIACSLVDAAGNVLQEDAKLPAGSMLRIIGCDGKGLVDVQAADYVYDVQDMGETVYWQTGDAVDLTKGTFYRITVDMEDDYGQSVGGVNIYDLFEGMMFAG